MSTKLKNTNSKNEESSFINILILLLVIILSIALYYLISIDKVEPKMENNINIEYSKTKEVKLTGCDLSIDDIEKSQCIMDLKQCSDDSCYYEKGMSYSNETYCDGILDFDLKINCKASITINDIYERSVISDDVNICLEFIEEKNIEICKDNFYLMKRYNKEDLSYCDEIINEVIKNECKNSN